MTPVYLSKIGYTKVGDHWGRSISDLSFEASGKILKETNMPPDALIIANAVAEISSKQQNLGALVADALELEGSGAFTVEASGASGGAAVLSAVSMIRSGQSKSVLVIGVEKMRDLDPQNVTLAQGLSENADYSTFFGASFSTINALIARIYMREYNISREKLSAFPVLAHQNAATAEHAQFRKKFSVEDVGRSEIIADPLRVLDCPPVGDGAAAALFVSGEDLSTEEKSNSVKVLASESASTVVGFFERENPLRFRSTELAVSKALKKSKLGIDDIDLFEIHDSYSILAALSAEAIGLSKPGKACEDASSGEFDLKGKFPISTFGGMKARGYPIGASGVYQVCEAFLQLTGAAKANQVQNASHAMVQNIAGMDSSSFVHVFGKD